MAGHWYENLTTGRSRNTCQSSPRSRTSSASTNAACRRCSTTYAESGSWSEQTFRDNCSDFDEIRLRQRIAVDMDGRSTAAQMVGQDYAMPVALAPVGLCGMQSADGEIKAARAAEKFGVPFTLSTLSICSIEDVASNTSKPFWFQSLHPARRRLHETALRPGQGRGIALRWSSRSICRSWDSVTGTSRTASPRRPS